MNLIEALKIIRDECNNHPTCYTCPMRNNKYGDDKCYITTNNPAEWEFKSEHPMRIFV